MVDGLANGVTQSIAMQTTQIAQTQRDPSAVQGGYSDLRVSTGSVSNTPVESPQTSTTASLTHHVSQLKQQLNGTQYTVEFDTKSKAQRDWLNIVDKSTGQVVYKIPPEQIRRWIENSSGTASGLSVDSKG